VDSVDDPMRVIGNRTIQGRSQQVPKIVAYKTPRSTSFADEELASSIEVFRAPRWTVVALPS
jgi:hypothetical protein